MRIVESDGMAEMVTTRDFAQPPARVAAVTISRDKGAIRRRPDIEWKPPGRRVIPSKRLTEKPGGVNDVDPIAVVRLTFARRVPHLVSAVCVGCCDCRSGC